MARWHLATLTEHQEQAIRELEERLGLVLVAYTQDPGRGGRPVDWEFGAEWGDAGALAGRGEGYAPGAVPAGRGEGYGAGAAPPGLRRGYA